MKKLIILILIFVIVLSIFIAPNTYKYKDIASLYLITVSDHEEPDSNEPIGG